MEFKVRDLGRSVWPADNLSRAQEGAISRRERSHSEAHAMCTCVAYYHYYLFELCFWAEQLYVTKSHEETSSCSIRL